MRTPGLVAMVVLAGCASGPQGGETVHVDAFGFAELNKPLVQNETFRWQWTSTADLRWDVHSHPDGVVVHDEGVGRAGEGSLTAPAAAVYSLSWRGQGEPAELWILAEAPYHWA